MMDFDSAEAAVSGMTEEENATNNRHETSAAEENNKMTTVAITDAPSSSIASSSSSSSSSPPFIWVQDQPDVIVLLLGDMPGVYTGFVDVTHKIPHGPLGTISYPDGRSYSGAWHLGHWQAASVPNATLQLANGDVYMGQTNDQAQRHGCGKYLWNNDGREYIGFWQSNLRHGQGKYAWANGAVYEGSFEHGQRQGHGKYTYPDGAIYVGEFHQGLYQGHGIFTWPNGRVFSGLWEAGVAVQKTMENTLSTPSATQHNEGHEGMEWEDDEKEDPSNTHQQTANDKTRSCASVQAEGSGSSAPAAASLVPWDDSSCEAVVDKILTDANGFAGSYRGIVHKPTKLPHGVGKLQYKHNDWFDSYEGFWDMGKFHGQGTVLFANGDEYKGEFSQGRRHGQGTYRWTDGRQYDGQFHLDQRTGTGTMSYANSDLYEGDFINGQRQGQGRFVFADGSAYVGEWKAGKFHGQGELTHPDGRVYRGTFVESAAQGHGVEWDPLGQVVYEGEWIQGEPAADAAKHSTIKHNSANPPDDRYRQQGAGEAKPKATKEEEVPVEDCKTVVNGQIWDAQGNGGDYTGIILIQTAKPHGVGRMIYQDGRIHEGFWERGNRHGHGRCLFQNGDFHEGNYKENLRNGPGVYRWKDGRVYQGEYLNDARVGKGRFTYPNGDTYNGNFKDGQRHGYGRFEFHEGGYYDGEWVDGKYHGRGKIVFANGQMYEGEFKQGHCHGQGKETDPSGRVRHEGRWDLGDPVVDNTTAENSLFQGTEDAPPGVGEDHEHVESAESAAISEGHQDVYITQDAPDENQSIIEYSSVRDDSSGHDDAPDENKSENKPSQQTDDNIESSAVTPTDSADDAENKDTTARAMISGHLEAADDGDDPVESQPRDHYSQDRQAWRRSLDMVNQ